MHQDFCRDCQDASRLSRFVKTHWGLSRFVETQSRFTKKSWHCRDLLSLKMMKSLDGLRNLNEKCKNPLSSWRVSTISTNFLISISIETFWSGHWCRDEIEKSRCREVIKKSRCRDKIKKSQKIKKSRCGPRFLNCRDALYEAVETLKKVETNRDPQA